MSANDIRVVIGSWGSYNACNERALGSDWLTLNDYEDWEEIAEELQKQGFILDGIDEELFIQDIENFPASGCNWDFVNPATLFDLLKRSGILDDSGKYDLAEAYCDVEGYRAWEQLVEQYDDRWDDDIYIYEGMDWEDLGYYFIHQVCCIQIPEELENYIDYRAYGEQFQYDGFHEFSGGIIEIRR